MIRRMTSLRDQRGISSRLAIQKLMATFIARLRLWYYTRLRRTCDLLVWGIQTLAPELQSLVMFAIDYHCIHYLAGSTGCEMVYGLKRSKIVNQKRVGLSKEQSGNGFSSQKNENVTPTTYEQNVVELTSTDKTKSAILAALLPYWKERCDKLYSRLKEQPSTNQSGSTTQYNHNINTQNMKDVFLKLYPYIHLSHDGSIFLYQFAYLLEYTPYWSFSLHALGVILRRMTVADVQRRDAQKAQLRQSAQSKVQATSTQQRNQVKGFSTDSINNKSLASKVTIPNLLRGALLFSVSYTIVSGWYRYFQRELSLRRRRWIAGDETFTALQRGAHQNSRMSNDDSEMRRRPHHPIPPPPMPPKKLTNSDNLHTDKWACPLCHEPRINPTASTSGFVFCYKCLVMHIRRNGEYCPLIGMPCKESQVVRLYESTSSSTGASRGVGIH